MWGVFTGVADDLNIREKYFLFWKPNGFLKDIFILQEIRCSCNDDLFSLKFDTAILYIVVIVD